MQTKPKESEVLRCQIQEWYPHFRRETFRTIIQVIPQNFVDYLLEDGLFLSRSSQAMPARTVVTCPQLQSEDYDHWDEEDDDGSEPEHPTFPQLEESIRASIETLGGSVFPKFNWSAPKDSAWISTTGTLLCKNFGEIFLLLKASDSVAHDLLHAFDCCDDKTRERPDTVVLALRKWYDVRPELEFRAFVFGGVLVGISQRDVTGFYPSIVDRLKEFEFAITNFYFSVVKGRFEAENYTFDCYVTTRGVVKLMDFNPWGGYTLPLLFSWEELEETYERVSSERNRVRVRAAQMERVNGGLKALGLACNGDAGLTSEGKTTRDDNIDKNLRNGVNSSKTGHRVETGTPCPGEEWFPDHGENRVEIRLVMSEGLVQPGIRIATAVPIEFAETGNWEDFIKSETA